MYIGDSSSVARTAEVAGPRTWIGIEDYGTEEFQNSRIPEQIYFGGRFPWALPFTIPLWVGGDS
jgi:hypothetical protein